MRRSVKALAGGAAALLSPIALVSPSMAQAYPTKPVRLIVSVNPGGNLDLVGRSVAQALTEGLGRGRRRGVERSRKVSAMSSRQTAPHPQAASVSLALASFGNAAKSRSMAPSSLPPKATRASGSNSGITAAAPPVRKRSFTA